MLVEPGRCLVPTSLVQSSARCRRSGLPPTLAPTSRAAALVGFPPRNGLRSHRSNHTHQCQGTQIMHLWRDHIGPSCARCVRGAASWSG